MKIRYPLITAVLLSFCVSGAYASGDHATHGVTETKEPAKMGADAKTATNTDKLPMTDGEIKKVDKESGKITIKHGEIKNLDMPAMTMVFRVKNSTMLEQFKAGDKINFIADKINGNFTVTQMETTSAK